MESRKKNKKDWIHHLGKKERKKLVVIGIGILGLCLVFLGNVIRMVNGNYGTSLEGRGSVKLDSVTRGQLVKMVSLLCYSKEEIELMDKMIEYEDCGEGDWYYKYVNAFGSLGYMESLKNVTNRFYSNQYVTYGECLKLVELYYGTKVNEEKNQLYFLWEENHDIEAISWNEWLTVYDEMKKTACLDDEKLSEQFVSKSIYILGNAQNIEEVEEGKIVTDLGQFSYDGLELTDYIDSSVVVAMKENEILYIESVKQEEKELDNVWIISCKDTELKVFINGIERTFTMNNPVSQEVVSKVADIVISKKKVKQINIKPDTIREKVLVANDQYIELEKYGKIEKEDSFKVYQINGNVAMELNNAILVGYDNTDFVVSKGKICAALIHGTVSAQNIRVLIKTNQFKSNYHKKVTITCDGEFTAVFGDKTQSYKGGDCLEITNSSDLLKKGRVKIQPKDANQKLIIKSLQRGYGIPGYRGAIEVEKNENGLIVINELSLEEYLYAVIPSEMPTSYGLEALKVQAICARSYAYNHLLANSCSKFGAHVDDSTTYQVYNNQEENDLTIQAVNATYGKVLEYNHKVIFAYYFSTSCGMTADINTVWQSKTKIPYMKSVLQTSKEQELDLSTDKNFRQFLNDTKLKTYDSDYPWYRWEVDIAKNDLQKMVNNRIASLYKKKSSYVQTLGEDGVYRTKKITTIGEVKEIKVRKRESSGLVTQIEIIGTKATVLIKSESFIRQIFAPSYDAIVRKDGSEIKNLALLPSAFFCIEAIKEGGKISSFKLCGGGYGHGVGMSQNGVKTMIQTGKTYEEVLKHYYDGIEIGTIY